MIDQPKYHPPKAALRLVEYFCADQWLDEITGDLQEQFEDNINTKSLFKARLIYWWEVFRLLRPHIFKRNKNYNRTMFNFNHIKISYRNLLKNKVYAFINILGLSVGIASVMLIAIYVNYETSYDKFFEDSERIHRVALHRIYPNRTKDFGTSSIMLAPTLKNNYPQIEAVTRLHRLFFTNEVNVTIAENNEAFVETQFLFADSAYFKVFSYEFIAGTPATALDNLNSVILTESTANRYFGKEDALNKTININGQPLQVTGVIKDIPANSHVHFDLLGSIFSLQFLNNAIAQSSWVNPWVYTYAKLKEGVNPAIFEAELPALVDKYGAASIASSDGADYKEKGHAFEYFLQPIESIHLGSQLDVEVEANSDIAYVYVLSAIALIILTISSINFVNLSIARSTERAKEVGIRKVMGSNRAALVWQFLTESIFVCFIGSIVSILLVFIAIPRFNEALGTSLDFTVIVQPVVGIILLTFIGIIGIVSGFYPAMVISALQPSHVLKGSYKSSGKGVLLRNGLITLQFIVSIVMIAGSIIVDQQMTFLKSKSLGFNQENLLVIKQSAALNTNYNAFRNELLSMSEVSAVGGAIYMPGDFHGSAVYDIIDTPDAPDVRMSTVTIDDDYIGAMEFEVLMGRGYDSNFNDSLTVVINEAAMHAMGVENPIGMKMQSKSLGNQNAPVLTIVGVLKDYNFSSLHSQIEPVALLNGNTRFIPSATAVRVKSSNFDNTLQQIQEKWSALTENTFNYSFLNEDLQRQYEADRHTASVFDIFTYIAVIMSCTGLFGLATYIVNQRSKEMSIRKVLGASLPHIIRVFSREFLMLIALAFLLATPLAYFTLSSWLANFAYHVNPGVKAFALAGSVTLVLVLITVSYQAIRVALVNPVKILRSE